MNAAEQIQKYHTLNTIAKKNAVVLFGEAGDKDIPTTELAESFGLETSIYNRSFTDLSLLDAAEAYTRAIDEIKPAAVLVHLGEADSDLIESNPDSFENAFRVLIAAIRKSNPSCRITLISSENPDKDPVLDMMNQRIRFIAESEQCRFADLTTRKLWNPNATKEVVSFVKSIGFVRPLKTKTPDGDIISILYGYSNSFPKTAAATAEETSTAQGYSFRIPAGRRLSPAK